MKVLVTGGTGFLGSHLVQRMVSDGHDVRVLSRTASELAVLKDVRVDKIVGDVCDTEIIGMAVRDRDWVVHAAADLGYWKRHEERVKRVNVEGTRKVAGACRAAGVARLLFVSSIASIGIPSDPQHPASEDFAQDCNGLVLPYAVSKRLAEERIAREIDRGLNAVIVNPAVIVGPYRGQYRGADMMNKVRRSPVVPYFSGGICVVHVEDVVAGIVGALKKARTGHRYILGGENVTFRAIVERTADAMGLTRRFVRVPPTITALLAAIQTPVGWFRSDPPRFTYELHYLANRYRFHDWTKARQELGYRPRDFTVILDECLRLGAC